MLQDGLEGGCGLGPVGIAEKGRLGGLARTPDNQGVKETLWQLGMDTPGKLPEALGVLGWEGFAHWFWVSQSLWLALLFWISLRFWLARLSWISRQLWLAHWHWVTCIVWLALF